MESIEKEFVPYDIALELKQLGFDEPCLGFYNHQGQLILMTQEDENSIQVYKNSYVKLGKQYAVPLHQQAFRWFREKYGLFTQPNRTIDTSGVWYYFSIATKRTDVCEGSFSYEKAELACLRELIKIVKEEKA
jgi:hypothetical protein